MGIAIEELPVGITKVTLDGRLDIQGAAAVDLQMNVVAGSRAAVLIDLEQVTFLASMGVRTLLTAAHTLKRRGGRLCLYRPTELVRQVLATSGVDRVIPVDDQFEHAVASLLATADPA
jgi:anti-anti-sigma factor